MDAEADLHLVCGHTLLDLLGAGQGAAAKRHAEGLDLSSHSGGLGLDLFEGHPGGRGGARGLEHEECAGQAPRLLRIRNGDVVADNKELHVDAVLVLRPRRRDAEAEAVAGVVHAHEQTAGLAACSDDGSQHRVLRGRCKDVAANGRRQEALSDEAREGRLVAGAPAANDGHLAGVLVPVGAQDNLDVGKAIEAGEVWRGSQQPVNRLCDYGVLAIDETLCHSWADGKTFWDFSRLNGLRR
mmetsp:Transcript_125510/g.360819  ORF Transcript_125510/g.360819 Transcript_125510/m.360819 type:complete len:241 (-) Transcript_125510:18-740(-)